MAQAGEIRVDISEPIVTETLRVLRERFGWDGYRINQSVEAEPFPNNQSGRAGPNAQCDQGGPPDNRILECAAEAGSSSRGTKIFCGLGSMAEQGL
jgi:hypothetical protein